MFTDLTFAIADLENEYADPINDYTDLENEYADLENEYADPITVPITCSKQPRILTDSISTVRCIGEVYARHGRELMG